VTRATQKTFAHFNLMSEKRVYVVTGANRGIGLEMVQQLAADKNNLVFATARDPDKATELKKLASSSSGSIEVLKLDTSDEKSIQEAAKVISGKTKKVHVLINNAGILENHSALKTSKTELLNSFNVNVAGVLLVTQALFPLLETAQKDSKSDPKSADVPKVINLSTGIASFQIKFPPEMAKMFGVNVTAYRVSKTALNALTACFAAENPGVAFLAIHPGWVDTDMGRGDHGLTPPVKPAESVKGILSVVSKLTLGESGSFKDFEGNTMPW